MRSSLVTSTILICTIFAASQILTPPRAGSETLQPHRVSTAQGKRRTLNIVASPAQKTNQNSTANEKHTGMKDINAKVPDSVFQELSKHLEAHKSHSLDDVITHALKLYLDAHSDMLFQVSTSSALVEGVYRGAMTIEQLLEHGDLGLGTFEGLDGELIAINGEVFQARGDGSVHKVDAGTKTPFAVITEFTPTKTVSMSECPDYASLQHELDRMRDSENLFYAIRVNGVFDKIHLRAICKTSEGVPLVQAAAVQPEFHYEKIEGTLVGFWSPKFAKSLNVPGYHMHFISKDRQKGGHVLACSAKNLQLELQREIGFTTILPENEGFLHADLSHDPTADLDKAEKPQQGK